ncbi:hypothetical protein [Streptomyces sp. NPDC059076]|uniref:hypothetical protein n=1 Tax=unclassified Streptomyces TaxID=2593676 RepID=UPI003690A666
MHQPTPIHSSRDIDVDAVQAELEDALARIESLRHQHPYEASGYAGTPRFLPYDRPPSHHAA